MKEEGLTQQRQGEGQGPSHRIYRLTVWGAVRRPVGSLSLFTCLGVGRCPNAILRPSLGLILYLVCSVPRYPYVFNTELEEPSWSSPSTRHNRAELAPCTNR